MDGPELWRELGQQLRVDSVRAAAVTTLLPECPVAYELLRPSPM